MADKQASYAIRVESTAKQVGDEGASSLEKLRTAIETSQGSVKALAATMRNLKGSSDEVKGAREALRAQLDAEKNAITASTLALLKQGTTFEKLTEAEKKAADERKKLEEAMKTRGLEDSKARADALSKGVESLGGPFAEISAKASSFASIAEGMGGALGELLPVVGTVAAGIVALTGALVAGVVAFARWIVEVGNASRSMQLLREGVTGTVEDATHLGHQLDALARKVPTPREELNKLGIELVRSLSGTRVSGQGIVDTFNAIAQSSSAAGEQAGAALEEIIKRSARVGRVQINPFELQGKGGPSFAEIAQELAKQLHIGVQQAQAELISGRVKVDDAAKAMRAAVEKRFGALNAKKLIDANVIVQKFKENLGKLASDVNLEPLLAGFGKLAGIIDTSTVGGAALKQLVTYLGNQLGPAFEKIAPVARAAFLQLEIGAYKVAIAVLQARNRIAEAFGDTKPILTTASAVAAVKQYIDGIAQGAVFMVRSFVFAAVMVAKFRDVLVSTKDAIAKGWDAIGAAIPEGLKNGLMGNLPQLTGAIESAGEAIKDAFKNVLGIHSPSKVFEEYGQASAEGYSKGLEGGGAGAQSAAEGLAPSAPRGGGGGGGKMPVEVTLNLNVNASGGQGAQGIAKALSEPQFLALLTAALEAALRGRGVPTQTAPEGA